MALSGKSNDEEGRNVAADDGSSTPLPPRPSVYHFVRLGQVLATRTDGRKHGQRIADALAMSSAPMLLSFDMVAVASPSFLDEALTCVHGFLRAHDRFVFATGCNDDVRESLVMVLERRKLTLAEATHGEFKLLGGTAQLQATLNEAVRLREFQAVEMAEHLRLKLPALHQRLNALRAAGALVRERDPEPERGVRFVFRVAPKEALHA